ncbi:hypothetical protein DU000_03280 [Parvibium lacunae]|uniref:Uncharacterized protein n=1 Tax=Parvibium lacunae TaxID=1888893 RepID=A0A368L805_9BURK|nr:hypothetical protein DU000_03280 [Parvibium lacunae]
MNIVSKEAIRSKYNLLLSSGFNERQARASIKSLFGVCEQSVNESLTWSQENEMQSTLQPRPQLPMPSFAEKNHRGNCINQPVFSADCVGHLG